MSGTKERKKAKRKWGQGKPTRIPRVKQLEVLSVAMAGKNKSEIAKQTGLNRQTVVRILSQQEFDGLIEQMRSRIAENALPVAYTSLMKLLKKADRVAVMQTLFGTKVLSAQTEVKLSQVLPPRDYADTKVEFYYKYGRWPTMEEAKEFDKTIPVEPLKKGELQ
jgi:hypothetical protein